MDILSIKIIIIRRLMHILLGFTSPSNKYVIKCSQFLDTLIVRGQLDLINKSKKKKINYNVTHSSISHYLMNREESLKEVS